MSIACGRDSRRNELKMKNGVHEEFKYQIFTILIVWMHCKFWNQDNLECSVRYGLVRYQSTPKTTTVVYWILIAWMRSELKYNHRSEMITRITPTTAMHYKIWTEIQANRRQEDEVNVRELNLITHILPNRIGYWNFQLKSNFRIVLSLGWSWLCTNNFYKMFVLLMRILIAMRQNLWLYFQSISEQESILLNSQKEFLH